MKEKPQACTGTGAPASATPSAVARVIPLHGQATPPPDPLLAALRLDGGVVCMVGAGGKKSLMYAIAARWPGRVGLTTTTHICPFSARVTEAIIVSRGAHLARQVSLETGSRIIGFARPAARRGRLAGLAPGEVREVCSEAGLSLCLVKADGARGRWIKAPAFYEPVPVPGMRTLIPVVSARVLGRPLTERIAHRLEQLALITGARPGETLRPLHLARLLGDVRGALKGVGDADVVPVINMVDDAGLRREAREAAGLALECCDRFDRILLCCLKRNALLEVVQR